jgi:hypothetical protein
MTLVERLRLHRSWRDSHGELNDAPNKAADALETAERALERARPIIQDERDVMVECHSCPPDKNATDYDPDIREDVEAMDAALAAIDAALEKIRSGL